MMQHRFSWGLLMSVLIANSDFGNSEIVTRPRNVTIQVGSSAYFNCSSSVPEEIHWTFYAVGEKEQAFVYGLGDFLSPYKGNFAMEKNETAYMYNLIIPSVRIQDAGKYVCQDRKGGGDRASAQLTVRAYHDDVSTKSADATRKSSVAAIIYALVVLTRFMIS